ncbi:hypothetical protein BD410DRAFT_714051 [Rickenella mellea]|uniref:Phytocyanin domain-containing protein n=1 Tax=Rickenella mellea TaxID=50990 RepID=A0A4Y7QJG2_9AGAM|nr:hypothetical protein BD410DRAFT_714051 [Rickenella mellea]
MYESGGYSSQYNGGYDNNKYTSKYESGGYSSQYNGGYNNGGYNSYTSTEDSTSTQMYESTSTSSAYNSYSTMSYGSGSSNWNNGGYDSCVQQCMASYGSPMATYTPDNSGSYGSGGSSGTGATWTVIVAPTQGVLRYVPFAVNASVGDTVKFVWNANVHTVTKSSQLELCNKTSDGAFASGSQNKSFVFTQVVNSTDPTFFYCGTPNHCQKGMFGIINPPSAISASTSVANMMPSMVANNSDIAAMNAYTNMQTLGNNAATTWGNSMDMSGMPDWSMPMMAQNVMYTRTFLAANPEVLSDSGKVDLSAASSLMVPQDITAALAAAPASSSSTPAAAAAGTPAASTTPAANAGAKASGARGLAASGASAAIVAIAAAFFAL